MTDPHCPGCGHPSAACTCDQPPPADPRLLALANRAIAERVEALEAELARLRDCAPDHGFIAWRSIVAFCACGATQIVDPAYCFNPRGWLRGRGWDRPPTTITDPDVGWRCPHCAKEGR